MREVTRFSHGFEAHDGVPDLLANLPGCLDERWVLVARLDSAPPVRESPTIAEAVAAFADEVDWTPAGVVLPGPGAARVVESDKLFYGFDEVVVFEDKPTGLVPPPVVFTSDGVEPRDEVRRPGGVLGNDRRRSSSWRRRRSDLVPA
jgi:hypothetical protein